MRDLHLPLKKNWFDLTKLGVKIEDYRAITPYWFKRLVQDYKKLFKDTTGFDWDEGLFLQEGIDHIVKNNLHHVVFVPFAHNVMKHAYPSAGDTDRIVTLSHQGIEVRGGNPQWGAIPGVQYFVIMHGDISEAIHRKCPNCGHDNTKEESSCKYTCRYCESESDLNW